MLPLKGCGAHDPAPLAWCAHAPAIARRGLMDVDGLHWECDGNIIGISLEYYIIYVSFSKYNIYYIIANNREYH